MEFYFLRIFALICSIAIFIYTLYLIRIKKLSADLAVSWIMTEIALIILLSVRQLSSWIFQLIGETNFYSVVLFVVIGWIITLMLDTLVRVSQVTTKTRAIAQEHALLAEKMERLERIIEKLGQFKQQPPYIDKK
jgi:hypothetical protein